MILLLFNATPSIIIVLYWPKYCDPLFKILSIIYVLVKHQAS